MLWDILRESGRSQPPTSQEVRVVMQRLDRNMDGRVSKDEMFLAMKDFYTRK